MTMNRRWFVSALTLLIAAAGDCHAQTSNQVGKSVRMGILVLPTPAKYQVQESALIDAMRDLGWIEGRNIVYDRVYANDDVTRLPALAAALVSRSPDLIHVGPTPVASAALAATRTIPVVFASVADPVENGFAKSLAHPGGNATGVSNIGWELGGKRLQLLKQVMPNIRRVGVLVNPLGTESLREQKLIEQVAAKLGVIVISVTAREAKELEAAFSSMAKHRCEALLTTQAAIFTIERKRILELAATLRLPVVGHRSEYADDGALIVYGALLADQFRRSAQLVDKILKGTKPADLPVELPSTFELAVNKKTAKTLGITMPGGILLQANRVIE